MINQVIHGDCLDVLLELDSDCIDLIYLDPPFFTQRNLKQKTRDNTKEFSFDDTWDNRNDYCRYIKQRLQKCHSVLKKTGSLFLHCDTNASHVLRLVAEEVFGEENFQSEIIWSYRRWSNAKKGLLNAHQTILFFSKSPDFKFNFTFQDYSPSTNVDQIVQKRTRNEHGKSAYSLNGDGKVELIEDKKGVPLNDVWDIPYLNPKAKERVGYPTQKPIILIEKIISLVTDENDLVLDPFCGSGTTLVAAKILNRKFIGIDRSSEAVILAKERIATPIKSNSKLMNIGRDAYRTQDSTITEILNSFGAVIVQRNKGIDGLLRTTDGLIPIRILRDSEIQEQVIKIIEKAISKNGFTKAILLDTKQSGSVKTTGKITITSDPNFIPIIIGDISHSLQAKMPVKSDGIFSFS